MRALSLLLLFTMAGCSDRPVKERQVDTLAAFEARLATVYREKPSGYSRAYAIMKKGMGDEDWLATVHGFPDNGAVCEELIKPYNNDPSLSVLPGSYRCKLLDGRP